MIKFYLQIADKKLTATVFLLLLREGRSLGRFANLTQILPQDHTHFVFLLFFFAGFQWNMLGDSINSNNFNCNPVVLKIFY